MASGSRGNGPTPLQRELGDRIKSRRQELELTQAALAEKADLHYTYIGGLETGVRNPSIDLIARLAKAMDMDLGELVAGLQELPGRKAM